MATLTTDPVTSATKMQPKICLLGKRKRIGDVSIFFRMVVVCVKTASTKLNFHDSFPGTLPGSPLPEFRSVYVLFTPGGDCAGTLVRMPSQDERQSGSIPDLVNVSKR